MRLAGNALIAASLVGLLALGLLAVGVTPPWALESQAEEVVSSPSAPSAAVEPPQDVRPVAASPARDVAVPPIAEAVDAAAADVSHAPARPAPAAPSDVPATAAPTSPRSAEPRHPIDRIAVPSIGLDAEVVPAHLVKRAGVLTWTIPAFRAGHADGTAGAGAPGNAVLLGHVDSLRSGDVFRNLEKVALGDPITVWSGQRAYVYRIVEARAVGRTDTALIGTTEAAALTLVTCTGVWSPVLWDYTERFVVRADLTEVAGG